MEQENYHQCLVQEEETEQKQEVQDVIALKGRKSLNDAGVIIPTSSFFLDTNGCSGYSNDVCLASVDETLLQKEEELVTSQKEEEEVGEMVNNVENENHIDDNHAEFGLGVIAELVGAATNGETIDSDANINVAELQNMNSLYFDKQQGMWKCHHCSWTKRFDSPWSVPLGNLKGYSDLLMIQHGPCFVYETKGIEFNGLKGVQNGDGARPVLQTSHGEGEIDTQVENSDVQMKKIDNKVPFSPEISPLQNSSEVQATTVENFGDKISAITGPNLMNEIYQQLEEELDVEEVLTKQETHDLFCPNCNSCITKRVILKKRKRSIKHLDTKAKRDKLDTDLIKSSEQEANQDDHGIATSDVGTIEPPPADNHEPETEPEVFRCLSCFSFFIPLRNGFKLFPTFGGSHEPETSQNPSITPASNLENPSIIAVSKENWFFSLFASNDRKKARGPGDSSVENPRLGPADHHHSSFPTTSNVLTSSQIDNPEDQIAAAAISKNAQPTPDTKTSVKSVVIGSHMESSRDSSVPPWEEPLPDQKRIDSPFQDNLLPIQPPIQNFNDVMNEEQKIGMDFTDIPANEEPMNDDLRINVEEKNDSIDVNKIGLQEPQSPAESFGSEVFANDVTSDKFGSEVDATIPSDQDFMNVQKDIEEETKDSVREGKQEPSKSSTSQTEDDVPDKIDIATEAHTHIDIGEQPSAEAAESQQWEIVKSIVYGGLIESITSLGIVSSAASSGATSLNIIALGLANLIGGLFIIGHDLIELKSENSGETNTQEDRYQEVLGRRANFLLHAVVAVLSFLIFGSVPLVAYGLLSRENYSIEVKILVVAATSVVCIILLAIGKAYTKTAPKSYIKTVFKYVTMAVATSGVSYIAGDLIKNLLEKFTGQDSSLVIIMPFSGTKRIEPALMSY